MLRGERCAFGEQCRFSHDAAAFIATKPPDIGPVCPFFKQLGACPYGLACRFSGAHGRAAASTGEPAAVPATPDAAPTVAPTDEASRTDGPVHADDASSADPALAAFGSVRNALSKAVQIQLNRRRYAFPRADAWLARMVQPQPQQSPGSGAEPGLTAPAHDAHDDAHLADTARIRDGVREKRQVRPMRLSWRARAGADR